MKAGDVLDNPVTGMRVTVIQTPAETDGRCIVVEYRLRPHTGRGFTLAHAHRRYEERFDILAGRAAYVVGGVESTAEAGETVSVPINTAHIHPWSVSDEALLVRHTTEAALAPDPEGLTKTLLAAETLFELARRGRVNANGQPNPLQAAVIFNAFLLPDNTIAGLPHAVQRPLFSLLAAAGRLWGYRAVVPAEDAVA